MRSSYDLDLRTLLGIPPLEEEISGAQRMVRCLFKPSFHREGSISLVERDGVSEMTIRCATRSIWSWTQAREGSLADPITDWVEPAASIERRPIELATHGESLHTLFAAVERDMRVDRSAYGIDGMSVDVTLWRAELSNSFSVWFGPFDEVDSRHRLIEWIVRLAIDAAEWELSIATLECMRDYVRCV